MRAAVTAALSASTSKSRGVEVNVEGIGSVVSIDADAARIPASTQKIYIGASALARFGPGHRFVTEIRPTTAASPDGTVQGRLIVRAVGDPGLTSTDLATLADGVVRSGVKFVSDGLGLDDTAFDSRTRLDQWKLSFTPGEVGSLSAFVVDGNRRFDAESLRDPGLANLRRFRALLTARGVRVGGTDIRATAPAAGVVVASVNSAPLGELVKRMLKKSDNTYAEVLTKQLGRGDVAGSTEAGVRSIGAYFASLGVPAPLVQVDGSGLSSMNRSTARQQVQFLRKVAASDVGNAMVDALPIACVDGTLRGRFCATTGASVVQAKTGAIDYVSGLSGFARTASGRRVVFSFLLNATTSSSSARAAIDRAVVAITASTI